MSEAPVLMVVAAYRSRADAEADLDAIAAMHEGDMDHIAAVLVEKGAAGALTLERQEDAATNLGWTGALLGALLAVVAAPLGVHFLGPVVSTRAVWAGVAVLVNHIWYELPKETLRQMSDVLETSQAAVVVVVANHDADDIEALLPTAAVTIRAVSDMATLEADYANAINQANAFG